MQPSDPQQSDLFKSENSNTAGNETGILSGKARLMKAVAVLYGVLVAGVLMGLLYVVQAETDDDKVPVESTASIDDTADVDAVIEAMQESLIPAAQKDMVAITYQPSWQRYAAPAVSTGLPKIAIVIDDLGLSEDATFAFTEMPGPYTLAYLPYADNLPEQTERARRAGHELLVHMPMEPDSANDPGPNALLKDLETNEFSRRISWNLSRFNGFVGVNNHMGSLMTEQAGPMVRLMVILRQRGMLFMDSLTSPKSVAIKAANAIGVPSIKRDVFLDNDRDMALIAQQLALTERIARSRGYAIAIGHPYEETLKALDFWRAGLSDRGFELVPLSQLVAEKQKTSEHTGS